MQFAHLFENNIRSVLQNSSQGSKINFSKHIKSNTCYALTTEHKSSKSTTYFSNKNERSSPLKSFNNTCGLSCKNLKLLSEYSQKMREIVADNEHLRKVNEYLMFHLDKKEEMYMKASSEFSNFKKKIAHLRKFPNSDFQNSSQSQKYAIPIKSLKSQEDLVSNKIKINIKEKKSTGTEDVGARKSSLPDSEDEKITNSNKYSNKNIHKSNQYHYNNPNLVNEYYRNNGFHYNQIPSLINSNFSKQTDKNITRYSNRNLPHHIQSLYTNNVFTHYEKINEFIARDKKRMYKEKPRASLLSVYDDNFHEMIKDHIKSELYELTLSDDNFIEKMRGESDDKLLAYSDAIGNLIIEYKNSLKLIRKIKSFLKASVNLVNSVLFEDFTTSLIKNACEILNCERTTLFVLDKVTNELVVHSGQGLKKSQVRVSKEQGIVGICFKIGQKVKVDDAYSDIRFNQEVDKLTGYKTKTILCMPLKDENGEIFGVIQSINKKDGKFDEDDEELMEVFSAQASVILKNTMNFDENYLYACRLRMILEFNFDLEKISTIEDFTLNAEHFLLKLFNSNVAQFLVYDEERDSLIHFKKSKVEEKKKAGIVLHVLTSKEFYGCNTIDCKYYNNLSDIGTGLSLVTFPILDSENNKVLAIVQMKYNYEIVGNPAKPKTMAMSIFEFYIKICKSWMEREGMNIEETEKNHDQEEEH